MVLLSTKKYPDESTYKKFVRSNGGINNASTSSGLLQQNIFHNINNIILTKLNIENTTYYFTIKNEKYIECLDIFSQIFIEPYFIDNAIEREINAVDSEFTMKYLTNGRRLINL